MRCSQCGQDNQQGRKFCGNCGGELGQPCGECGFANLSGDKFCGGCGKPLALRRASAATEGEMRPVTILFADLSGYTRHSNSADPDDVRQMLNRFFALADDIIITHGGSVDKHIGDCVMAVFGAPVAHEDDAVRACAAAHAILMAGEELAVHAGIAAGQVLAGAMGSRHHGAYTVTGAAVNLASRLCGLAEAGEILVAAEVAAAAGGAFEFTRQRSLSVAGFSEQIVALTLAQPAQASASASGIFVGRERELRQLEALIDSMAETGHGQVVELIGEAGIGKSRLVERIEELARGRGMMVRRAQVSSHASGEGADISRLLLRALSGLAARPDAGAVATLLSESGLTGEQSVFLYELLGLAMPDSLMSYYDALGAAARRSGRAELLSRLADRARAGNALAIVIEDIHWAESESIAELADFVARLASRPILLLMTSRPEGDPIDKSWRANTANTHFAAFDLGPLGRAESEALARQLSGGIVAEALIGRAEGNPLFLTQLVRHMQDLRPGDLPDSLRSVILARLDRLSEQTRHAAQAASVLGTRFTSDELAELLGEPVPPSRELVNAHIARTTAEGFEFIHALIRDAVYGTLPKARRARLHLAAAQWFRQRDAGLYAHHLELAQDEAAAMAFAEAARLALAQYRNLQAAAHNARGLALAKRSEDRLALLSQRGEILYESGDIAGAVEAWRGALALDAPRDRRCHALISLAQCLRVVDAVGEAEKALNEAQAIAEEMHLDLEQSRLHFVRGNIYFPQGRVQECLDSHQTALAYARRAASLEAEARAYGGLGDANYALGRMKSASQAFGRCVDLARELGFGRIEVANLPMLAITRLIAGDFTGAQLAGQEAIALAQRVSALRAEMIASHACAFQLVERSTQGVHRLIERAEAIAAQLGAKRFQAQNATIFAYLAHVEGSKREARELAQQGWKLAAETARSYIGPYALAVVALTTDDPAARLAAIKEAQAILDSGAISHNHFFFNRCMIEDCFDRQLWDETEQFCAALQNYTASEPLPWSDFWIDWGRAAAKAGRNEHSAALAGEFDALRKRAALLGFDRAASKLAQIETPAPSPA